MNVYGQAMTNATRQAHNNVVQMVLKKTDQTTDDSREKEAGLLTVV
jgi:hypothetical protein